MLCVARAHLSVDVALNEFSEAVEALVEQVLQVPAPRLRVLKHRGHQEVWIKGGAVNLRLDFTRNRE